MNNRFTPYPNVTPSATVSISAGNENASKQKQQSSQAIVQPTIPSVVHATVKPTNPPVKPTNQASNTQKQIPQVSQTPSITLTTKPIRERPTKFASLDVPSFKKIPYKKMPRVIEKLWKDNENFDYLHDGLLNLLIQKRLIKEKQDILIILFQKQLICIK